MAKRKKRSKLQGKKRAAIKRETLKTSRSGRGKATKRRVAKATLKRAAVKKAASKEVRRKRPVAPTVETTVVDVIEKPAPGVITVMEFEETEIREERPDRDEPEEC
jgi:DNA helicase TIP49 (TBP-interacting protein)